MVPLLVAGGCRFVVFGSTVTDPGGAHDLDIVVADNEANVALLGAVLASAGANVPGRGRRWLPLEVPWHRRRHWDVDTPFGTMDVFFDHPDGRCFDHCAADAVGADVGGVRCRVLR